MSNRLIKAHRHRSAALAQGKRVDCARWNRWPGPMYCLVWPRPCVRESGLALHFLLKPYYVLEVLDRGQHRPEESITPSEMAARRRVG